MSLTIPATTLPSLATVIFLHGLGQTNSSWIPWVQRLAQRLPGITWILPQADTGFITLDGVDGPRWFDVFVLPPREDDDDRPGVLASKDHIHHTIQGVINHGLPSQKVFLVGFSQGSAMAMLSGLTSKHVLGGIAVLAGWLPPKLREIVRDAPTPTCPPLFWAHGTADKVTPLQDALVTMQWLRSSLRVEQTGLVLHEYPGLGHSVSDDMLQDLHSWLAKLL